MDAIAEVSSRKTVRSWVQFEQRTVEDKDQSKAQGKFVGIDMDYVLITPAYGKDDVHKTVKSWKLELEQKRDGGKISQEDYAFYLSRYEAWKKGLEAPPDGTAIKGWGVISPAQQKMLTSVGILTVEDLSMINDEGVKRIGMGAVELKRKANAWLAQLQDKGPLTVKMAAIETENDNLKIELDTLRTQVAQLMAMAPKGPQGPAAPAHAVISAADVIPDDEPTGKRKR